MRRKLSNYFYVGGKYKDEVRKQIRAFFIFTLAFTIAFSWRETTLRVSESIMGKLLGVTNPHAQSVWASVFITVVCLFLIFLAAKWLKDKKEHY